MVEFGLRNLSHAEQKRLFKQEMANIKSGAALGDRSGQPIIPDVTQSRTSDISKSGRSEGNVALHSSHAESVATRVDEFTFDEGMGGHYPHDFGINDFDQTDKLEDYGIFDAHPSEYPLHIQDILNEEHGIT